MLAVSPKSSLHPSPGKRKPNHLSVSLDFPALDISYKWNTQCVPISVWLCSHSLLFSRLIHVVTCIPTSFLFTADQRQTQMGTHHFHIGFPGGSDSKDSASNARDLDAIPELGRSPEEGNGNPLQYSCLENPMDRGAWGMIVHGAPNSQTQLSN